MSGRKGAGVGAIIGGICRRRRRHRRVGREAA
jgi:hypothetical protein